LEVKAYIESGRKDETKSVKKDQNQTFKVHYQVQWISKLESWNTKLLKKQGPTKEEGTSSITVNINV